MRILATLLASMLMAACASAPAPPGELFDDPLFAAPSQRVSADHIFAVSAEMKRYIKTDIADDVRIKGPLQGLFDALYSRDQLKLEYESSLTRNAEQAFSARSGNCLSLVIMTAAFAREMGLAVTYQHIYADEIWGRSGDIYLSIGHVNLTLSVRPSEANHRSYASDKLTIDFVPAREVRGLRSRPISEKTLVAMYMNNRAVESMIAGRIDDAYAWAREAIAQDPQFMVSYNTLGAVYRQHGNLAQSLTALRYAHALEPKNTRVISNLVSVLNALGQTAEAGKLGAELALLEPNPPFYFFERGIAAMRRGEYDVAKEMFAKEVARAPYYHEFHYWLAVALANLGDYAPARKHMQLALEGSLTRGERDLYAAKLDRINAHRSSN